MTFYLSIHSLNPTQTPHTSPWHWPLNQPSQIATYSFLSHIQCCNVFIFPETVFGWSRLENSIQFEAFFFYLSLWSSKVSIFWSPTMSHLWELVVSISTRYCGLLLWRYFDVLRKLCAVLPAVAGTNPHVDRIFSRFCGWNLYVICGLRSNSW